MNLKTRRTKIEPIPFRDWSRHAPQCKNCQTYYWHRMQSISSMYTAVLLRLAILLLKQKHSLSRAFWWVLHSSYYTMAIKHVFEVRLSGCRPLVMHDSRIYILKQSKSAFSKHMHIGPKVVNLQFKQHCTVWLLTSTQASDSLFVPWQELMYINNQYI